MFLEICHTNDDTYRYRGILDSILLSSSEEAMDALKIFIEASMLRFFHKEKKNIIFYYSIVTIRNI